MLRFQDEFLRAIMLPVKLMTVGLRNHSCEFQTSYTIVFRTQTPSMLIFVCLQLLHASWFPDRRITSRDQSISKQINTQQL